ncbi:MAG: cation-translocating P-type ATPase [Mycoplasma sp.]
MENTIDLLPHTIEVEEIAKSYNSDVSAGLTQNQVNNNLAKYGPNKLSSKKQKSIFRIFLEQYKDILMIVLLVSATISLLVGIFPADGVNWGAELLKIEGWENFILIVSVTIINSILGTVQVVKSRKSLEGLKKLSQAKSKVIRDGISKSLDSTDLVVGDLIIIEAGDIVPADARLISANNLRVNESSLTGESVPIFKVVDVINENEIPLGDRLNMVFSGCLVTSGRAMALVTSVGVGSEIGKINKLLNETDEQKTPLQVNLDKLAKVLMWVILGVTLLLFVLNISKLAFLPEVNLETGLKVFTDTLNFSIALAVAVIPEALSSIVTIVLSVATKKMSKKNAIIKELKAVEGLGSVSVICSDKTGTLTQNKMTVTDYFINNETHREFHEKVSNLEHRKLIEFSVLCSDAKINEEHVIGDPTEIALVQYLHDANIDSNELHQNSSRISELPFDSDRMMMSTLVQYNNKNIMLTKGAIDAILPKVTKIEINGKIENISKEQLEEIQNANKNYSDEGKRVLTFCYKEIKTSNISHDDENDFIFIGLIAMIDPPRPEVIQAVKECYISGIKVVMITGDHEGTAKAIGKEIGIFNPEYDWAMSGLDLSRSTDVELSANIERYTIYSRVSPEDKIKIVRAWQSKDKIISMTGDGVNDAPALKQANIGVAMGITGTEVSKDAASIILSDDNFATIITAVKFGRSIYNNIKGAIRFLLTGNIATIFVATIVTIFSLALQITISPFTAIQLLFLNLLTDSWPAISIGLEKYRKDVIYEKPRNSKEFFLNKKFTMDILWESCVMAIIVLATFFLVFYTANGNDNTHNFKLASGMAFMALSFCRFFHGFNCKSEKPILFTKEFFDNKYLLYSLLLGMALMSLVFYTPGVINLMFSFESFSYMAEYMIWVAFGFGALTVPLIQGIKYLQKSRVIKTTETTININN